MKRFLSSLLVLCMAMTFLPASAAAASVSPFGDVQSTDWYYDEVQYVYENGLMSGTSATTFSPDTTTTRGMIVTILHRLEGTPAVSTSGTFADVTAGRYYTDAVEWASANGIVGGYGNGRFGPNDPITREQMAAILYRYAAYKEYDVSGAADLSGYSDASSISSYARVAMQWANHSGLVNGTSDTTLSPQGSATRAQAAVILYRFCEEVLGGIETEGEFTVTFEYNYGSKGTYETVKVDAGETVEKPKNPTRSGYGFDGWYTKTTGGTKFDFDDAITADLTLYAHWSSNSGGGSSGGSSHSHSYTGEVTTEATCTTEGVMTYTCRCGDTYTESIPALGHKEDKPISNGNGTHDIKCVRFDNCHYYFHDDAACTYDVGTAVEGGTKYTCTVCGYSYVEPAAAGKTYVASIGSTGYETLQEAVTAADADDTIVLLRDIALTEQLSISKPLTINGNGKTISANNTSWRAENGYKNLVHISSGNVTLSNVTLNSNNQACGLNVYQAKDVTLSNVTLQNSKNAGLIVNASTVNATNLNTSGNVWGAVNVDKSDAKFTLKSGTLSEANQIWSELLDWDVVDAPDSYYQYDYIRSSDSKEFFVWTTTLPAEAAAKIGNVYYQTLDLALKYAEDGDTITLLKDAEYTTGSTHYGAAMFDGNLTIEGQTDNVKLHLIGQGVTPLYVTNGTLTIKNLTVTDAVTYNPTSWYWMFGKVQGKAAFKNVTFENGFHVTQNVASGPAPEVTFTGCTFKNTEDAYYSAWVNGGTVSFDRCSFPSNRGLKIHDDNGANGTIRVTNCTFNNAGKPGVALGTVAAAASISITDSTFTDCAAGDQGNYIYETDSIHPTAEGNKVILAGAEQTCKTVDNKNYVVFNADGMMAIADVIASVTPSEGNIIYFKLAQNVDMSGKTWTPMAMHWANFDGQGHKVSNLTCGMNATAKSGFAGYLGAGTLENLTLENVTAAGEQAGIIAGNAEAGTLTNVTIAGANTVSYQDSPDYAESWGGVGAIFGVNTAVERTVGVTVAEDATITLNYNSMTTESPYGNENAFIGKVHVTANNGTVTAVGSWANTVSNEITTIQAATASGKVVVLSDNITVPADQLVDGYGDNESALAVRGGILDGNGKTLSAVGLDNTRDCTVYTTGGTIKNLTIDSGFRGIMTGGLSSDLVIDNVTIDGPVYTIHGDSSTVSEYKLLVSNSTINGWTSYSNMFAEVKFTNCSFGEGAGYAFLRPYQDTTFDSCDFEAGFVLDPSIAKNLDFTNCTIAGVAVADNQVKALLTAGAATYDSENDVWYAEDGENTLSYISYNGDASAVVIPDTFNGKSVTAIGDRVFDSNTTVTSVTLPDSITSIGNRTFRKATALNSITLPADLQKIDEGAFQQSGLTGTVVIPENVTEIAANAFYEAEGITSINVPAGVTVISDNAFRNTGITEITLHTGITKIGSMAFRDCKNLTTINYSGTMEQWKDITVTGNWVLNATAGTTDTINIICTDGTIVHGVSSANHGIVSEIPNS